MPISVTMPRLSDTMQQGTIVKWNVKEGQKVKSGDTLADIETDKATMELQSFDDGVVAKLAVAEGQQVPVGTVIVVLAGAGEDASAVKASFKGETFKAAASGGTTSAGHAGATALAEPAHSNGSHAGDRVFVSPLAKKIAQEANVNLTGLHGSGPGGRIVRKDVEEAIRGGATAPRTSPTPAPRSPATAAASVVSSPAALAGRTVALSTMRRVIATRLVESKTSIPHYQVTVEADMDPLLALRAQLNEQLASQGVKLSVNDFLVRACALAMLQHPYVNSRWVSTPGQESIQLLADVNVGVAISLDEDKGGGLVVATLRGADRMGLREISSQTRALADKARSKGLSPQEMSDSTFTISNLGMFGVDHFTAIINPPNVAILAVGGAIQKPVVRNNQVVPGHVMSMTMSSDHRVIDGAMAAKYLSTLRELLEKPAALLV